MGFKRPVGAPRFEICQALRQVAIDHRLRRERDLSPLRLGFQQVADVDADLPANVLRNDHLIFVLDRNERHTSCTVEPFNCYASRIARRPRLSSDPVPKAHSWTCALSFRTTLRPSSLSWRVTFFEPFLAASASLDFILLTATHRFNILIVI